MLPDEMQPAALSQIERAVRKIMDFVLKTRNFVLKTRDCVSKTRNFVFKMMNLAAPPRWPLPSGGDRMVEEPLHDVPAVVVANIDAIFSRFVYRK